MLTDSSGLDLRRQQSALALVLDVTAALLVPVLFVLVVPFEKLFPRHRQRLRRPGVLTDIAYGLTQPLLAPIGIAVGLVIGVLSLAWLPGLALRPLVDTLPSGVRTLLGVVLFDLVAYWAHRWSHEVPFLWRFHAVHHSTVHLDWVSGLRNHPFDGVLVAPPFLFLVAAGFGAEFAGALAVVQIVTGLFLHANVRWRWRALHRVVSTPEFHHWHHADEADAHNSNYSIFLPVWDLLFGTYFMPKARRPSVYGVTPPLPAGLVEQLRHPLRGLHGPYGSSVTRSPRPANSPWRSPTACARSPPPHGFGRPGRWFRAGPCRRSASRCRRPDTAVRRRPAHGAGTRGRRRDRRGRR